MKAKTKKPLRVSKIDQMGILFGNLSNDVTPLRHRVSQLERRVDSQDATIARETQLIREQFLLTHEWQERALRAESELSGMKADRDAAAKRSQEFRDEDAGRAEKIRDILKPYDLHLVDPIGGVRELAKLVDHWREKFMEANEKAGAALKGLEEKDHWRSRALKAEERTSEAESKQKALEHAIQDYARTRVSTVDTPAEMPICGNWKPSDPVWPPRKPTPNCECVRFTRSKYPLSESSVPDIVLYGTWEDGLTAIANRRCAMCGGTGYPIAAKEERKP